MARAASSVRVAHVAIAILVMAGCDGRLIRLGDAITSSGNLTSAGGSGASRGSSSVSSIGSGSTTCQHGQVNANEVVWIGDSWIQIPGTQHTHVRDLARAAGAIGPNDDYVDLAMNGGVVLASIVNQYDLQEASATKVKVLIMNGGGIDSILANGSDASTTNVVSTFKQHLDKVASDGTVQHIVYFFYPELSATPTVVELRPGMQAACAASAVPCHFLDLQPLWVGHPEYTSTDGLQASEAGGTVIGDALWALMQQYCIAQ